MNIYTKEAVTTLLTLKADAADLIIETTARADADTALQTNINKKQDKLTFDKASLVVDTNKLYAKYVSAFALGTTTETTQPLVLTNNLGGTTSSLSLSLLSATETKAGLMSKQLFLDLRNALPKNPNGTDNLIGTDNKIGNTYLPDFLLGQVLYGGTIDGSGVCSLSENFISKYKITTLTITKNESNIYEGVFFIATASLNLSATTSFDSISLATGDWLISNGGEGYNKIDNTDAVTGVKGNAESTYRIGNVNITPTNIGLGNVVNTGDSATPVSGGTTKFTTGGAFTELAKKQNTLTAGKNVTIDANSKISVNIEPADYASANTQLNGLTINGTNYKILDVKVNDGSSLIIGGNRELASGAGGAIALGVCSSSTASASNSTALGNGSTASGYGSTVIGNGSKASGNYSTALGQSSKASGGMSTAIGVSSEVYVPNWVGFDGITDNLVRTVSLKSTDNIFFRNEDIKSFKTTQASYTSGKTLTQVLNTKQDTLVSGTNIKTINGNSLLGSGNVAISGGGSDALVRIHIYNISDETTGTNNNELVFVGYRNLINTRLEKLGLDLETLKSNWQTLMTGEKATQIWGSLCKCLSLGYCFSCFYTLNIGQTVSAIINNNYLGFIDLNGTTPEGHIVFNSETTLKAAFADSSMVLDKVVS